MQYNHSHGFRRRTRRSHVIAAPSYVHWIRNPRRGEQFQLGGKRLTQDQASALIAKLKLAFSPGSELDANEKDWANPSIPAGYTYAGQFIAHDLTQNLSLVPGDRRQSDNGRAAGLVLDTLYGAGPTACPIVYAIDDVRDQGRSALRLDPRKLSDPSGLRIPCDIGRIAITTDGLDPATPKLDGKTEALVADPRNDDNALISQFTAAMSATHNAILKIIRSLKPRDDSSRDGELAFHRFVAARAVLETTYRRLIRDDYLKRICHPVVWKSICDGNLMSRRRAVPVEFSHAAFRFGHAMVRPRYRVTRIGQPHGLGRVLVTTSADQPALMPLDESWIADWSNFFPIAHQPPPMGSRRIGPSYTRAIDGGFPLPSIELELVERDLQRALDSGMWSLTPLLRLIEECAPKAMINGLRGDASASPTFDPGARESLMATWLEQSKDSTGLDDNERAALAKDPPLLAFVLREAQVLANGKRLGPLGSMIVADTIAHELAEAAAHPWRRVAGSGLPLSLEKEFVLDEEARGALSDLVRYVQSFGDLFAWTAARA